uniref:Uncharacterized protein n=1 Tax=Human herpesvirus 2 TaxID=10310 RepID=A0A481TX20_HHV2|nr:hypothetical protein [Human alphaherpesvirus 2]
MLSGGIQGRASVPATSSWATLDPASRVTGTPVRLHTTNAQACPEGQRVGMTRRPLALSDDRPST